MYERPIAENCWEVEEGLYRILLPLPLDIPFVNVYLVHSGSEWALIDAGFKWSPALRALGRALKAIGVPSGGLTHLVLTHRHKDHAGGAEAVRGRWGGRIYLHPADQELVSPDKETSSRWLVEAGVPAEVRERFLEAWRPPLDPLPQPVAPLTPEQGLPVGELRFEVMHTPGHAPGHVMLHEPRRGWIFAGDHLLTHKGPNTWHTPGTAGNPLGDYLSSLQRVQELPEGLILPGHGLPWRGRVAPTAQVALEQQRGLLAFMQTALAAGPQTLWELTSRVVPEVADRPNTAWWALAAVLAQLRHLESEGLATCSQRNGLMVWQALPQSQSRAQSAHG